MRRLAAVAAALIGAAAVIPTSLHGQYDDMATVDTVWVYALPPNAAAITECLGGRIRTMIDIRILGLRATVSGGVEIGGTDSLEEILVHELAHQTRSRQAAPGCYFPLDSLSLPDQFLLHEVVAFCASLPIAVRHGYDPMIRRMDYVQKMYRMFGGNMPLTHIVAALNTECPAT